MPERIGLVDYALVALLRLGGDAGMVDLEDIAVEAYRLAPDRFRWRRHDYPNLELVRVVLSDANKGGAHLVLRDGKGRMLSAEGTQRATHVLGSLESTPRQDDALRRQDLADLVRMEHHPAFAAWRRAGVAGPDAVDLADLARCSVSTPPAVFEDRLRRSQALAARWHRDELAYFLGEAADHLVRILAEEIT